MNRAIISGATGTIGIALIEKLVEEGVEKNLTYSIILHGAIQLVKAEII